MGFLILSFWGTGIDTNERKPLWVGVEKSTVLKQGVQYGVNMYTEISSYGVHTKSDVDNCINLHFCQCYPSVSKPKQLKNN